MATDPKAPPGQRAPRDLPGCEFDCGGYACAPAAVLENCKHPDTNAFATADDHDAGLP